MALPLCVLCYIQCTELISITVFPHNMRRLRLVIRNPAYIEGSENYDDNEIDPMHMDLALLESCLAPIVTALAGDEDEDKDMSEGESFPGLETDQLLDEDIPGIMRPSTLTQTDDEEVEQLLKDIGSEDEDSLRPVRMDMRDQIIPPAFWTHLETFRRQSISFLIL